MMQTTKNTATATITTAIGPVTLFADRQGLTGITLPSSDHQHAHSADESTDNSILRRAAGQIQEYFLGQRRTFSVPLHIIGTDFQKQVWDIISRIPYGRTISYGDIARQLGGTGKARAVGGAAHANPLPLIIPCHRVIGSDGSLTGFGSGIELKKRLLALEKHSR